jgi:hypothetical protein
MDFLNVSCTGSDDKKLSPSESSGDVVDKLEEHRTCFCFCIVCYTKAVDVDASANADADAMLYYEDHGIISLAASSVPVTTLQVPGPSAEVVQGQNNPLIFASANAIGEIQLWELDTDGQTKMLCESK